MDHVSRRFDSTIKTIVYCQSKRLTSVPVGIPTNRQELWLYDNQITKLEPGVFDRLTALEETRDPEAPAKAAVNLHRT
ncbi:unnamed protein product [Lampetra fluviatilis]